MSGTPAGVQYKIMTRTVLALVILLALASCNDDAPAAGAVPDDAAATDALGRGEALGSDAGGELAADTGGAAETRPAGTGGSVVPDAGGSGGAAGAPAMGTGGSGGAVSTGGSDGGAGGAGGAPVYPTCMPPAGTTIDGLICRKLVGDVFRATRRDGLICVTGCVATTADGRPAGYQGEPLFPACAYATSVGEAPGYLCVAGCQGCQP